jgi:CNT family concentrative nucleoside transporter
MFDYSMLSGRQTNLLGIAVVLLCAWLLSTNRRAVSLRTVVMGLALHSVTAFVVLRTTLGRVVLEKVTDAVSALYLLAEEGSRFVFGSLVDQAGPWGFLFAFKVLPIIIFFGALMSVLFYLGIVQRVVAVVARVLQPLLGTSGAETLCAIANSFLGQTEAPLLIRHYLGKLTKSQLFLVMVSGMGTMSGSILAVYTAMGVPGRHLLAASVMAISATIVIAKIMLPDEEETPVSTQVAQTAPASQASNILDALSQGTSDGLSLALNVGAMLIAFIAMIALCNKLLAGICLAYTALTHGDTSCALTVQDLLGYVFYPFGWLLGVAPEEIRPAAAMIGTKLAVNEMVAYSMLVKANLSARSTDILTYALCGFANLSSIGIQLGGIGALVPERRLWLSQLGLRAVIGGALASLLSAMVAGLFL